ncbi:MAG: adenylate kinase [Candidatus Aenigmarchaeota archaeon]|nr:adenylate kinase [Candidatus Aenigmarchaeota archaeon]
MKLVLLGPPGSGKGTYSSRLAKELGIPHISTGDLLREEVSKGSELGKKAKEYMDKGELVPNEIVLEILKQRLQQPDCEKGFILDGFPRNLEQAKILDEITEIDKVIYLDVPDEIIIERLSNRRICKKCGAIYNLKTMPPKVPGKCDICGGELYQREDDKPEVVKNRLVVYRENTTPLINYYKEKGILVEFKIEHEIPVEEGIKKIRELIK